MHQYLYIGILYCPNDQQNFKLLIRKIQAPRTKYTNPSQQVFMCSHMYKTVGQNFSTRLAFQNHFEIRSQDSTPTRWSLDLWDILAINLLFFTSFSVCVLSFPSLGWFLLHLRYKEARHHKCRYNRSCKTHLLILML